MNIAWVIGVGALIQLLPITYAGLGLREGALVVLLGYYGISSASAMAYSFLIFNFIIIFAVTGGFIEFFNIYCKSANQFMGLTRTIKHSIKKQEKNN